MSNDSGSTEKNPWTTLEVTQVYDNPWIQVTHHDVLTPAGKPGLYGTVHFKNKAVGILPLAENGDTWLVGQYRFPLNQYHWEIPMGGSPLDEAPEHTALRELKEETGLSATELLPLGRFHMSNCIADEEGFIYLARGLTEGEQELDDTEELQIRRVPFAEAFAMASDGRITDALSVMAILKVRMLGLA